MLVLFALLSLTFCNNAVSNDTIDDTTSSLTADIEINESIINSTFDGNNKTKFIIHGFNDGYTVTTWMTEMKNYILEKSCDNNVIAVDWSNGAKLPFYLQAVANTRVVAAIISNFIDRLVVLKNTSADKMNLIGHSLGAHIAGFAGKAITSPKLAQITGLDPAGPAYQTAGPSDRLNQTDASLVVNIHTDAGVFGILYSLGHYDIYPNGGSNQPGCQPTLDISVTGLIDVIQCSHIRAYKLAVADPSVNGSTCQLIAYECDSYEKFVGGGCADCGVNNEKCKPLPLRLDFWDNSSNYNVQPTQPSINLYSKTSGVAPYCLFHYQIVVIIATTSSTSYGHLKISLFGQKRNALNIEFNALLSQFQSGSNYTYLLTLQNDLGLVLSADVFWNSGLIPALSPSITIDKVIVNYMSDSDPIIRRNLSSQLCDASNQPISSGNSAHLEICY